MPLVALGGASGGSGYDHGKLRSLWIQAGGNPDDADLMAHVALAESAGNPDAHNSYAQNGKTYNVHGLWQISDINGPGNYADPLTNARKAVALYRQNGLSPWEDSRNKGAGGGWGQYLRQRTGRLVALPGSGAGKLVPLSGSAPTAPATGQSVQQAAALPDRAPAVVQHAAQGGVDFASRARKNLEYAKQHPVEVLGDILGAAQRGVGGAAYGVEHHAGLIGTLRETWHDVTHADMATQERTTESIRAALHAPTHEALDAFVNTHVSQELRPYVSALLKGGEDLGLQMVSDPLSYVAVGDVAKLMKIPELVRGIKSATQGAQVAKAFRDVVQSYPELHRFAPMFNKVADTYEGALKAYGTLFHVRPDLDQHLATEGKHQFMQIETRHYNLAQQNRAFDERPFDVQSKAAALDKRIAQTQRYVSGAQGARQTAGHTAHLQALQQMRATLAPGLQAAQHALRDRYLTYVYDHGIPAKSAEAAQLLGKTVNARASGVLRHPGAVRQGVGDFLSLSPEEQQAALRTMRDQVQHGSTAKDARAFFGQNPAGLKHPVGDWDRFVKETAKEASKKLLNPSHPVTKALYEIAQTPRRLMQATLFLNPLPHGLKNVGELAFYAGGIRVVPAALAKMVRGGIDDATRSRLVQIGAGRPQYTTHGVHQTVWSHVIPGFDQTAGKLQDFMGGMEEAWRAALLEQLDRQLGKSAGTKDELAKGFMINDRLGDYRNQAGFVKLFEAVGGPWVAFRLGIVPKNVLQTIYENPRRVLAVIRAQQDVQHNRSSVGQHENELTVGGPTEDFSRMIFNPGQYFTSPSTLGGIGQYLQSQREADYMGPLERTGRALHSLNPLAEVTDPVIGAIQGTSMPGPNGPHGRQTFQHESLADRLLTATLQALAVQYYRQQSAQGLKSQHAHDKTMDTREQQYVKQLLVAPWAPAAGVP